MALLNKYRFDYAPGMVAKTHTIEVDESTARTLQERAAERGVSVSQVVAELVPSAIDNNAITELDRRWAAVEK